VANDDLHIRMVAGIRGNPLHGVNPACSVVQAEACHGQASLDEMHMGIDKGWREQPATKINFGLPRR
jgi:hypothetical protein